MQSPLMLPIGSVLAQAWRQVWAQGGWKEDQDTRLVTKMVRITSGAT